MCFIRRRENAMARERIKMRWRAGIIIVLILALAIFCWLRFGKKLSSCRSRSDDAVPAATVTVVSETQASPTDTVASLERDEADDDEDEFTFGSLFGDLFESCGGSADRTVPTENSEIELVEWEVQPDAESYLIMMREKYNILADNLAALPELERTLARCGTSDQVRANERYIKMNTELTQWCYGAQSYPAKADDERTAEICETADSIAVNLQQYLDLYPEVITGEYPGSIPTEMLMDTIMDDTVYLYELLYEQGD